MVYRAPGLAGEAEEGRLERETHGGHLLPGGAAVRPARPDMRVGGLLLLLALAACTPTPKTSYRVLPPRVETSPTGGSPIYAATLRRVDTRIDGRPLPPDPEITRSYVHTLRRASLFTDVAGPAGSVAGDRAWLQLASRLAIHQRSGGNLTRSILIGASLTLLRPVLPYHVEMDGEMTLDVRLPGTGETLAYRAVTAASRSYFRADAYPAAVSQLAQDVTNANLRSILAQMRSDPALTARPSLPHAPAGPTRGESG